MYLQYSRYLRRNIALLAIYTLLTIAVIGLLLILCVSNSRTDIPFMVIPRLDKPAVAVVVHRTGDRDNSLDSSALNDLVDTSKLKTLEGTGIEMNTESDQQHIYIDDVYNANLKLHKDEFVPITNHPIDADLEGDSNQGSGSPASKTFNFNEFEDDNDDDDDDDAVTSGSGNDRNIIYDLETKDFIKRISIKLSQLSKANPNKGQRIFKLGINRDLVPISEIHHRSVVGEKQTQPMIHAPQKKLEIQTKVLSSSRGFVNPAGIRATSFAMLDNQLLPSETQIRTRRIISNEKKSEERSRKLLLCESEMGNSGGRELCRMLFKETESSV